MKIKKNICKYLKNKKGFTILELVIVIAILGILAVMSATNYSSVRTRAKETAFDMEIRTLNNAAMLFIEEYPNTSTTWTSFAGLKANKKIEITDENLHDTWNLYLKKYPQDPTREKGATFMVEISANGDVDIYPDTYGHEE